MCILGDMLELGENSEALHRGVGEHAVKAGVELVIACGERSRATYEGAAEAGGKAMHFADKAELIAQLKDVIRSGDVVLVKASHCMAFEDIVAAREKL